MLPTVFSQKPVLTILACILSYLIGSVSSGILVSKAANGPDLHTVGSGNTGASNVQRTMGWKYGIITYTGDVFKGLLSCLIGLSLCAWAEESAPVAAEEEDGWKPSLVLSTDWSTSYVSKGFVSNPDPILALELRAELKGAYVDIWSPFDIPCMKIRLSSMSYFLRSS